MSRRHSKRSVERRLDALESDREDEQPLSIAEIIAEEQQANSTDMKEAWKRDLQEEKEECDTADAGGSE